MRANYQFDYDALPRNVRKQLAKSVASPDHLVYGDAKPGWLWYLSNLAIIGSCSLLIYWAAASDYGDPLKDAPWDEKGIIVWYAILFFGVVYAAHAIWQRMQLQPKFRFIPGRYLFPMTLVDIRSNKVSVHDLTQMRKLEALHHEKNGSYHRTEFHFNFNDGTRKKLVIRNKNQAEIALEKFNRFQSSARAAFQNRDIASLYGFDPFLDVRKSKWQHALNEPGEKAVKKLLGLFQDLKLPLIIIAIVLGALFWYGRSAASDKKMYLNAKQMQTEIAYTGYIRHGKYHVAEMEAEFPRVVFNEVQKKSSVGLLRTLKSRFPHSDIQADVNQEIHLLYDNALQKFRSQASNSDSSLIKSMESLLKFAEDHDDPNVLITFARPTTSDLNQLDAFLKGKELKDKSLKIIPAAKYFSDDSAATREARIVAGIRSAFASIFPNDVLSFGPGMANKRPSPMLQIAYQIEPSGKVFTSDKHDDAFVGLVMRFKAALLVPDVNDRWKFDLQVEPPDSFNVEYKTSRTDVLKHAPESQVYAVMAERAFDKLEIKIKEAFFRPDSTVFMRQMKRKI